MDDGDEAVTPDGGAEAPRLLGLVGIYHATGTLWGEVSYWVRARLGGGHCALCDITHGSLREKPEWRTCRGALPVPMETVHLDERDAELAGFTDGRTPCVVARTTSGLEMLLDAAALEACEGAPRRLAEAIDRRVHDLGLRPA